MRIALELHVNSQMSEQEHAHAKFAEEERKASRMEKAMDQFIGPLSTLIGMMFGGGKVCPSCVAKMREDEGSNEPEVH